METATLPLNSAIIEKTRELCTMILGSQEYKANLEKIETFFNDTDAQESYREFSQMGQELHTKQHAGELTKEDVDAYDQLEVGLLGNAVTGDFMNAEKSLNNISKQISQLVGKSLELGRLPEPEDMKSDGCCGGGCGC